MLDQVVREAAARFGAKPALVTPDETVTYSELDGVAGRVAAGLASDGVGEGSVVALVLPVGAPYVVFYCALARLGAITAGVSLRLAAPERARMLERLGADLVLTADTAGDATALLMSHCRDGTAPTPDYDIDRPVTIVFTSGTTGTPRGAVFTGRQLDAITRLDVGDDWGGGPPLVVATGLSHIGFMTKLPGHLRRSAAMHLLPRWRARDVLRMTAEQRIPVIGAVAAQVALMMREPDFDSYDLSAVQLLVVGAGPSPPELVREARRRFHAAYSIRYSSTESGGLGTLTAPDADDEETLHTVGRPRAGTQIRIDDGEVCISGAHVMDGYWRDPEGTADVLRDGWLHTGDLGYIDQRGCLVLTGRRSDAYIRGGYNVHPGEVEAVLGTHPAVAEVVVVPRPDPVMGEVGVAVVVVRPEHAAPSVDDLRAHSGGLLAAYKLPEAVHITDALPLTPMDKVDRRALSERARSTSA
jgi:acyl-CoA synthetase (AMP-forming)/AMP-acid ligase II